MAWIEERHTQIFGPMHRVQQVKAEHRHPTRLLHPLPIPEWKWETISMDFITGLPTSTKQNDAIMVVVDKLSKSAHFIPVKSTCKAIDIAQVFMKEVFRLHGMPKEIVSDRDPKFTSNFWKSLMAGLETKLLFSTTYHTQTDRQTERVNKILEYMLRMHVMHQPRKWEDLLSLSTTTIMASFCLVEVGNPVIKSMEMVSHFHSG